MRSALLRTLTVLLLLPAVGVFAQKANEKVDSYSKKSTLAVRYVEKSKTTVNIVGAALAPRVLGRADVEYKKNDARIKLKVENLDSPQTFGAFYTTYVAWAVTPEGQSENLIELPSGYTAEVQTQTSAQTFGIIITAEPHSAVKTPSQKLVAETALPKNAKSGIQTAQAEYKVYTGRLYETAEDSVLKPDYMTPRLVLGARRSMDIARRAGAKEYANDDLRSAEEKLQTLEQLWPRNLKEEIRYSGLARDVMRFSQIARDNAVEREEQARIEDERQARIRALEEAKNQADSARAEAERTRLDAERARAEAEKSKADAERSARAAEEERQRREQVAREAEIARQRQESEQAASRLKEEASRQELERARSDAESARRQADDAKRERDAALQKLYVSLSEILDTKRESRGFIVNIGDVLFDTGRATLKPGAKEKLSKLAGILVAYPGQLSLEIEGHTDSVGSDVLNNKLSENRANSVRDYLTSAGVKAEKIKATRGFGKSKPIAPNENAAGRQMNRRVEVIIEDEQQAAKTQ